MSTSTISDRILRLRAGYADFRRASDGGTPERLTVLDCPGAEQLPVSIRKAQAIALMLRTVPVHIYPDELIVGLPFREVGGPGERTLTVHGGVPGQQYIDAALRRTRQTSPVPYSPEVPGPGPAAGDFRYGLLPRYATPRELEDAAQVGLADNSNPGHLQAGHARVVTYGWSGLRAMAEARLATIEDTSPAGGRQAAFLQSVLIVLDGASDLAIRYATRAEEQAAQTTDLRRRSELETIASVCRRIATEKPRSWWEALQLHWLTHLVAMSQGARQLGRFDQYMHPFLAADLAAGRLDHDRAQELLQCLWLKYGQVTDITEDNLQNIILGGQTPDGSDATNELTYMCIDATECLEVVDPKLSIRLHRGTPDRLLRRVAQLAAAGRHQPGLYNDEAIVPALIASGIPAAHARDYTNDGCSELLVQGRTNPWCFEAKVHLLQCLQRVTEDLSSCSSFEDVYQRLLAEISDAAACAIANADRLQAAVPAISPNPFVSATVEGCIGRALDLTEGGALYNPAALCASGLADTADGLAALRSLVQWSSRAEERASVSVAQLAHALAGDFAGSERLRLQLLNRAPKFGNNDDEVDLVAVRLVEHLARCVQGRRNPRGGGYVLGLFSYGDYIGHGILTGATPDGRRAGAGISPNFSPAPGRDQAGPFSVLQSTAKVPAALTPNGRAVDITIHPSAVAGPAGLAAMAGLLRAFVEVGEMQVQFNVVDEQVLREAQQDPERYRNLTVRLWGFPAHFVGLPVKFQEHIIARTAHRGL